MTTSRGHADGALHSRAIEKNMAAAKKTKTITRVRILLYGAPDSLIPQVPVQGAKQPNCGRVQWFRVG
jgi:hypothetical protein